jgi:hypothetical protein
MAYVEQVSGAGLQESIAEQRLVALQAKAPEKRLACQEEKNARGDSEPARPPSIGIGLHHSIWARINRNVNILPIREWAARSGRAQLARRRRIFLAPWDRRLRA